MQDPSATMEVTRPFIFISILFRVLDYTLLEDSLCYDDGFTIVTDSAAYATHPLYFELVVTNDNNLSGVIHPLLRSFLSCCQ